MKTLYSVAAISKHYDELYYSRAQFIEEAHAILYMNILSDLLKSNQNSLFYRLVSDKLEVKLCIASEITENIYATRIEEGLPFLLKDLEGIQGYNEDVIHEILEEYLTYREEIFRNLPV